MLLETLSQQFRKARQVNQTSSGYVAKVPVAIEPFGDAATATGSSIIELGTGGEYCQNGVKIVFFGTGSDNNTFTCRVYGWTKVVDPVTSGDINKWLWVPVVLCEVTATLNAAVHGVDGTTIPAADYFADTIVIVGTSGDPGVSLDIVSPADGATVAHLVADLKGFQKLELSFSTGSSATDCNALVSLL